MEQVRQLEGEGTTQGRPMLITRVVVRLTRKNNQSCLARKAESTGRIEQGRCGTSAYLHTVKAYEQSESATLHTQEQSKTMCGRMLALDSGCGPGRRSRCNSRCRSQRYG